MERQTASASQPAPASQRQPARAPASQGTSQGTSQSASRATLPPRCRHTAQASRQADTQASYGRARWGEPPFDRACARVEERSRRTSRVESLYIPRIEVSVPVYWLIVPSA